MMMNTLSEIFDIRYKHVWCGKERIVMKLKYSLKGLDCDNCAQKVQERVSKLENVRECSVVFATTKMFVETDADLFQ